MLVLPNEQGGNGGSEWNSGKIATAMTLYKQILGHSGQVLGAENAEVESKVFNDLRQKVAELNK